MVDKAGSRSLPEDAVNLQGADFFRTVRTLARLEPASLISQVETAPRETESRCDVAVIPRYISKAK